MLSGDLYLDMPLSRLPLELSGTWLPKRSLELTIGKTPKGPPAAQAQLTGPNGIGKSTLLESLAEGTAKGAIIDPQVRVGYYRQDFSTLNFEDTVHQSLQKAIKLSGDAVLEENLRTVAAGFLITKDTIHSKIGTLSEGQKGLVAFASLVLQKPGLLILDEPTNHINFRHLPVIAAALDQYEGAMVLVSHVAEFVHQIRIDEVLDLSK
jgi:ATP-binding cassette subfamily F protein 3